MTGTLVSVTVIVVSISAGRQVNDGHLLIQLISCSQPITFYNVISIMCEIYSRGVLYACFLLHAESIYFLVNGVYAPRSDENKFMAYSLF